MWLRTSGGRWRWLLASEQLSSSGGVMFQEARSVPFCWLLARSLSLLVRPATEFVLLACVTRLVGLESLASG